MGYTVPSQRASVNACRRVTGLQSTGQPTHLELWAGSGAAGGVVR